MKVGVISQPVLVLPEGTTVQDAERLARLLEAHQVSDICQAMAASDELLGVTRTGLSAAPGEDDEVGVAGVGEDVVEPKRKQRAPAQGICGGRTSRGGICRRPAGCRLHRASDEVVEVTVAAGVGTTALPVAAVDMGLPKPVRDDDGLGTVMTVGGAGYGEAEAEVVRCPKCRARPPQVVVCRVSGGGDDMVCRKCGWRRTVAGALLAGEQLAGMGAGIG